LHNIHDDIDDVAENAPNGLGALSIDLGGRIVALFNALVTNCIQKDDKLGNLLHNDGLQRIGNIDETWLEGHFGTIFADEMFVAHPEGGGRRMMYEGFEISYEYLTDNSAIL
jgi:hypothetical protein